MSYLALGQENRYSKFFHLFSIIEFVEKRDRVCGALKQTLGNLTDIGRKEKLVHICIRWEFVILRIADQPYMNIDLAVTQLMYLCEQIIIEQMKPTH